MKLQTKFLLTGLICSLGSLFLKFLTPIAALLSNETTVRQLENSNSSSLAVTYFGNGSGAVEIIVLIFIAISLLIVWTRKTKQPEEKE